MLDRKDGERFGHTFKNEMVRIDLAILEMIMP